MMLMRSHSERRAFSGLSSLMTHSSPAQRDMATPRGSIFAPLSLTSPPTWMTQALCNLELGEQELQSLRERQSAEVEEVNRELDNAILEAQRQERRLLEKVEQDHREAQRRLEQVKRENAAAVRVGQSLVDRQLRKLGQLKEQIQRWGGNSGGPHRNQLQRGVAEATQPWEISLSLKRVSFQPSTQPKAMNLGEVEVQEHSLNYPIGVCGDQGQKCTLHSGEMMFRECGPVDVRKDPPLNGGGPGHDHAVASKKNSGSMRVVRKLRLSTTDEDEFKEEVQPSISKIQLESRQRGASESSQDEELESLCSDTHGQDLFLAFPPISSHGESEGDEPGSGQNVNKRRSILKGQRKQRTLVLVPSEEPSCSPEGDRHELSIQQQKTWKGTSQNIYETVTSPKTHRGRPRSSYSLLDLSSRYHPHSRKSLSPNKPPHGTSMDKGSPPSPADSEDSCYTFTANSPRNGCLNQEHRHVMSTADLSSKTRPLINGGKGESLGGRRFIRTRLSSAPSTLEQGSGGSESGRSPTSSDERVSRAQRPMKRGVGQNRVSRSLSLSAIEGGGLHPAKEQPRSDKGRKEKAEPALKDLEEDGGSSAFDAGRLVKQFGKQGSGRTDFNLPSGLHATVKGQLFVVDCGNARIQVTDLQKNVVQQVSPTGSERSARICNYFDVAVNTKGLIALTCAAERALLVFSRHGRLLQTFGGTMIGSTHEELDAPRGVTVTRLDEFLVADIKRGTLTALMLDPKTGVKSERTIVTGFHRPYLVAACPTSGLMAVSERGNETGRAPCIRVLEPGWNTIRILGVCSGLGPVLACPWGICIDSDGDVLVADWGKQHRVLLYPAKGVGWPLVNESLSSPRGLALLPEGNVVVSDSMNHCIKIYRYK